MTNMYNPPHPGELVRAFCLDPLGLSVSRAAEGLQITRKSLSNIINGHSGISPEMACRLSLAFGGRPETWLTHQMNYELWQVQKQSRKLKIKPFVNDFASA